MLPTKSRLRNWIVSLLLLLAGFSFVGPSTREFAAQVSPESPQYALFRRPSRIALENDTYESALRYLREGDRVAAINLIARDPLIARLTLFRLLSDPDLSALALTFGELFRASSDSEIEGPFLEHLAPLPPERRNKFVDWMEVASRAQFLVLHGSGSTDIIRDLREAREFFKAAGFAEGEGFCLRILARTYSSDPTSPDYALSEPLYQEALSIFQSTENVRGEVLTRRELARLNTQRRDEPQGQTEIARALQKLNTPDKDLIAEASLLLEFGTAAQLSLAWPLLDAQAGLQWLKYQFLAQLSPRDATYLNRLEAALSSESDALTSAKAYWLLYNEFDGQDTEKALNFLERAVELARDLPYDMAAYEASSPPSAALPEMLYWQGIAAMDLFQPHRAAASLQASLDAWRSAGQPPFSPGESGVLYTLAAAYNFAGDIPRAIDAARESLAKAGNVYAFQPLALLGEIYGELGDLPQAEELLRKASLEKNPQINNSMIRLARIHMNFGHYADAVKDMDDLDPEFDRFPNSEQRRASFGPRLRALALAWLRIGDLDKAMEFAQAAETRPPNGPPDEGLVGMVLIEKGQYPDAEKYFKERLVRFETQDPNAKVADAYKNLARIRRIQGRFTEANEYRDKALSLYRDMFGRTNELELMLESGQASLDARVPSMARQYFNEALLLADELHSPEGRWSSHVGLAAVAMANNEMAAATENLRAAITDVEDVSGRLHSDLNKSSFIEDKIKIYDDLINLLASSDPREAFEYAQRRRTQSFRETAFQSGIPQSSNGKLSQAIKDAEARLTGMQRALLEQLSKSHRERNEDFVSDLSRRIEAVRAEHEDLLRRFVEEEPAEARRQGVAAVVTVEELQQQVLKPGDALVDYVVTEKNVLAFVVTPTSFQHFLLPITQSSLFRRITDLREPFTKLQTGKTDKYHLDYDVGLANSLYVDLIRPLGTAVQNASRLIIIPDDVLHELPFESLALTSKMGPIQRSVRYAEYRDVEWLVRYHSIVYGISVDSLKLRIPQSGKPPRRVLAFGNPALGSQDLIGRAQNLRGTQDVLPSFDPLPESAEEAKAVARLLDSGREASVRTGRQARETEFLELAEDADYVHLAVHSLLDEKQPYYSALLLSPDENNDGWLQMYEVLQLKLKSRLVTLSGCETGLGRLYKGEGVLGLRRAFLLAGAQSVTASLWSIDDFSTEFMESFYSNIQKGQAIEKALQNAKLAHLLKDTNRDGVRISLSHPFFWAPFALASTSIS